MAVGKNIEMNHSQKPGIAYEHMRNQHTAQGAMVALPVLLHGVEARSLIDVGCGTGTWLRAALEMGISDACGVDGIRLPQDQLHVPVAMIHTCDLRDDWYLGRRFDVVLCLEVAEHLPSESAEAFIRKLTDCGDRIIFSAACSWQGGQNHVNAQWPAYWQALFNANGYACRDNLRWKLWEDDRIEPWYRQNIFLAEKNNTAAGNERRIPAVVHPDCMSSACAYWRNRQSSLLEVVAREVDRGVRRTMGMKTYE